MTSETAENPARSTVPPHRHCLPALAAVALVLFQPEAAHACGELPCGELSEVQPPDGSVGVPRNTELRALYFGTLDGYDDEGRAEAVDVSEMRLVPSGGEPIVLTGNLLERPDAWQTWVISQAAEPLSANTRYEVQLLGGREACPGEPREWTTVSSFSTGPDEDRQAPTFAGLDDVDYGERLTGASDCGTSDVIPVFPAFSPASDAAPATRYNIYVGGAIVQRYVDITVSRQVANTAIFVDCGSQSLSTTAHVAPGDTLELRAVDLAGNESPSHEAITVEASCAAVPAEQPPAEVPTTSVQPADELASPASQTPSAAADPDVNSGLPAAPARTRAAATGCAIAHERGSTPMLLLAAMTAWLSFLRRRR